MTDEARCSGVPRSSASSASANVMGVLYLRERRGGKGIEIHEGCLGRTPTSAEEHRSKVR